MPKTKLSSHQMQTTADSVGTWNDNAEIQILEKYKQKYKDKYKTNTKTRCNQKYTFHCYLFTRSRVKVVNQRKARCLVLINHQCGSNRPIIYVQPQRDHSCPQLEEASRCCNPLYFFNAEQILRELADLFLGSSDHFSISCFHLVLCLKGILRRARREDGVCR